MNAPQNTHNVDSNHESALRLARLEAYLGEDPSNISLLTEAFTTALQCAEWERAAFHVRHLQALQPDDLQWKLREGDLLLARGDFEQAAALLKALQSQPAAPREFSDTVLHNLAWIDFQAGRCQACIAQLKPRLDIADGTPPSAVLAALWLRAMHHSGQMEEAVAWAISADAAGHLSPSTAGVASLAALDAEQLQQADEWSSRALNQAAESDRPLEALVTQSSLALARQDAALARSLAQAALNLSPRDGRAWSAHAFADLLSQDLPAAIAHFDNALASIPGHIGTWHGKGWALLVSSDLEGARQSFAKALELDRNFAESHGGLAIVLALQGNEREAREHIERSLRLDASNLSGRYAQALVGGEIKDAASFQTTATRLLEGQGGLLKAVLHAVGARR